MIDSTQNKYTKLLNSLKSKKEREKNRLFVVEGLRFVEEIPRDYTVEFYAISEAFKQEHNIEKIVCDTKIVVISDKLFESLCDTVHPQGILAVVHQKTYTISDLLDTLEKEAFFIIAEELNDPGNLGTIIRTADAANCSGIILSKGSVDLYNPKTLRSTMGSVFHIPVITEISINEAVPILKGHGIKIYAAHLKGKDYPYSFNFKESCAFLIGNEARGLSEQASLIADDFIKIPMPGNSESLNASMAAGILMYEVVRQRLYV